MSKCEIDFDTKKIYSKIQSHAHKAQIRLDAQVLKDSNYYCPMDSGTLIKSGIISTVLGSGCVQWCTPYAKKQYYTLPHKSDQTNPNACMRWFDQAKSKKLKEWEKLANDEYNSDT